MFSRLDLCYELRKPKCVVQSPRCVRLVVTPWTAARQASLSLTISQSLLKFMSTAQVMPSMPSCYGDAMPLTSSSPSALNLSQHHSLFQCISSWHQLAKLLKLQWSCSATQEILNKNQVIYEWFSSRSPTNWGAAIGEGMATFLAAPSVPGRWALCSLPWSQNIGWRSLRDPGGGLPAGMLGDQLSEANQGSCDAAVSFCMGRILTQRYSVIIPQMVASLHQLLS